MDSISNRIPSMNESGTSKPTGISRRALAKTLGGAAAAVWLPRRTDAADPSAASSREIADARTEAFIEAALDTQKALFDVRKVGLGYGVDPATVFQAKP
jgi:hypothetical protein